MDGLSRRSFLSTSSIVATGVAATAVPAGAMALVSPASASASASAGERVHPTDGMPSEPVMAYVHNAARHEVTVLSGTEQHTYRDPILTKRLLAAARAYQA